MCIPGANKIRGCSCESEDYYCKGLRQNGNLFPAGWFRLNAAPVAEPHGTKVYDKAHQYYTNSFVKFLSVPAVGSLAKVTEVTTDLSFRHNLPMHVGDNMLGFQNHMLCREV